MRASPRTEPFTPDLAAAVRAFNGRLAAGGVHWRFPEDPVPEWLPPGVGSTAFQQCFVLLEGDQVRGGYVLKRRAVSVGGRMQWVGVIEHPLSEGAVNPSYATVALRLFEDALQREPLLCGVGLARTARATQLVRALGWRLSPVPFFFKVLNGTGFLREVRALRTSGLRRALCDLAAAAGLGWLGACVANAVLERPRREDLTAAAEVVDHFDDRADDVWRRARDQYSFVGVRDRHALNRLYPSGHSRLMRLIVTSAERTLGCAAVEIRPMMADERYGDLRVGVIIDGVAVPEDAGSVLWHATQVLREHGADLVVSTQLHPAWQAGLARAGFVPGPSNFLVATARTLTSLLDAIDARCRAAHVNRGDAWPLGLGFNGGAQLL